VPVILQDARKFTVQVRDALDSQVLGTGVVISRGGLVATCAHVVRAAGVDPRLGRHAEVGVYFPTMPGRPAHFRHAWVAAFFVDTADDLVCLQVEGPLPIPWDRVASISGASGSQWHRFASYGYRRLEGYLGAWAHGRVLGEVEPPAGARLLMDPVQLESPHIDAGMSGAPVLDVDRNLVVGVISETWLGAVSGKDRDTAWAVNADVIGFTPLAVSLREEPLPLLRAEPPFVDPRLLRRAAPMPVVRLDGAPLALPEWVGRSRLLDRLDDAWDSEDCLVVALVGFGGEGKTSLARHWADSLVERAEEGERPSVMWWSFTERASADDFLTAALEFVSGGQISPEEFPDGRARAEGVAALLGLRRFVFVLDGLEVMQHQHADHYGTVASSDLRDFLAFCCTPGHRSFCVLTTRAPVHDLVPYVTYRHVDVTALSVTSGRALLANLGVLGSDAALDQVVLDWGGHALTLSLIAGYLVKRFRGDVRRISALPPPDPTVPRDALVRRVLREYDACLSEEERGLLTRFSVFRTPVTDEAVRLVAGEPGEPTDEAFRHLVAARIVRRDTSGRSSMHPLVRDYYNSLAGTGPEREALHARAKSYYLDRYFAAADATGERVTEDGVGRASLESLAPVVEAVHHACASAALEEACDLIHQRLYVGSRGLITRELNAYETVLSCFADLFPEGRLRREPLVRDASSRGWVLHEAATCLQLLGRLREASAMLRRAMQAFKAIGRWHDAAVSCQNMGELHLSLGALPAMAEVVREAYTLAERAEDQEDVLVAATLEGALAHLRGEDAQAAAAFGRALQIAREHTPVPALYSSSGIRYAEHLRRRGDTAAARRVHEVNLEISRAADWRADEAGCLVGLGDLALDAGALGEAGRRYEEAFHIARGITRRDVLITALLARCRLGMSGGRAAAVRADLEQALSMAVSGGYRLAEVDARLCMARLYQGLGDGPAAWDELSRAEETAIELGYHWGQLDARELAALLD
jgi:tetratricopeptide (TPR) repeat protein